MPRPRPRKTTASCCSGRMRQNSCHHPRRDVPSSRLTCRLPAAAPLSCCQLRRLSLPHGRLAHPSPPIVSRRSVGAMATVPETAAEAEAEEARWPLRRRPPPRRQRPGRRRGRISGAEAEAEHDDPPRRIDCHGNGSKTSPALSGDVLSPTGVADGVVCADVIGGGGAGSAGSSSPPLSRSKSTLMRGAGMTSRFQAATPRTRARKRETASPFRCVALAHSRTAMAVREITILGKGPPLIRRGGGSRPLPLRRLVTPGCHSVE